MSASESQLPDTAKSEHLLTRVYEPLETDVNCSEGRMYHPTAAKIESIEQAVLREILVIAGLPKAL
jgi:hypothetical protein